MDFLKVMKQAKEMQSKMADMQSALGDMRATGTSGGGLVAVTLSGKGDLAGVKIDPSLLKPEDAEIVEDLILAAHADAKTKIEALMAEKMQEVTGGLGLPGGFKLPF